MSYLLGSQVVDAGWEIKLVWGERESNLWSRSVFWNGRVGPRWFVLVIRKRFKITFFADYNFNSYSDGSLNRCRKIRIFPFQVINCDICKKIKQSKFNEKLKTKSNWLQLLVCFSVPHPISMYLAVIFLKLQCTRFVNEKMNTFLHRKDKKKTQTIKTIHFNLQTKLCLEYIRMKFKYATFTESCKY